MTEGRQFITDYIAAFMAANPSLPRPRFEGPSAGGWYVLITHGTRRTKVRRGAIERMTKVLQERAKEESNA
jgi:hypothetical protein